MRSPLASKQHRDQRSLHDQAQVVRWSLPIHDKTAVTTVARALLSPGGMNHLSEAIEQEINALTRLRDEVRLQAHLAQAEARTRFDALEARLPELEAQVQELRARGSDGAHEIADAARGLLRELHAGYEDLRRKVSPLSAGEAPLCG